MEKDDLITELKHKDDIIAALDKRNREIWSDYNELQFFKATWKPKCFSQYEKDHESCMECQQDVSCRICSEANDEEIEGTDDA